MRYFFNIREGDNVVRDYEGDDLVDPMEAAFEARMLARELAIENLRAGREIDGSQIEITDKHGNVVETMKVRAVVDRY